MTTEPNTITFHNINADWVMRITKDRRIEVNEDVEVTEAAKKVLEAMQHLLTPKRKWVGLTDEEMGIAFTTTFGAMNDWDSFVDGCNWAEEMLKEKNT